MKYVDTNQEEFKFTRISVEDLDKNGENHEFSQRYQRRKEKLIKEYNEREIKKLKHTPFRVAVVAAVVCVVGTAGVYAAVSHGDFFSNALGDSVRESVTSHIEIQDRGDQGDAVVKAPAREYVAVDPGVAKRYLSSYMLEEPIVKKIGEHTLTIISAVRDKNSMVMEFTLERKGGENSLVYNAQTNEAKGAYLSEEGDIRFWINNGNDYIYVDINKSTDEKLYCYDYSVFDKALDDGESPSLCIISADGPIQQKNSVSHTEYLEIPLKNPAPTISYASKNGGTLEASALGMNIDMGKGLGLQGSDKRDPASIDTIVVKYKDGSEYIVQDNNPYIYNEGCSCGFGENYVLTFNRLVETDNIDVIEVNGIQYIEK